MSDVSFVEVGRNLFEPIYQKVPILFTEGGPNEAQGEYIKGNNLGVDISDHLYLSPEELCARVEKCLALKISDHDIETLLLSYQVNGQSVIQEFNKYLDGIIERLKAQKEFRLNNAETIAETGL